MKIQCFMLLNLLCLSLGFSEVIVEKGRKKVKRLSCNSKYLKKHPTKLALCQAQQLADNILLAPNARYAFKHEYNPLKDVRTSLKKILPLDDYTLAENFTITVDDSHECFPDNGERFTDRDLNSKDRVKALHNMIRSSAIFLKKLFVDSKGNSGDWFGVNHVKICAADYEKEKLPFKSIYRSSNTLELFLSYKKERHFCYLFRAYDYVQCPPESTDLYEMWSKGKHLDYAVEEEKSFLPSFLTAKSSGIKLEKLLRDNWSLLNPAGHLVPKIRGFILPGIKALTTKIKNLLKEKKKEGFNSKFIAEVKEVINEKQFEEDHGRKFDEYFINASSDSVAKTAEDFIKELNDTKNQNNLIRSMFASTATNVETVFENEQDGPINIANLHDINILITAGAPIGEFINYVKVIDRKVSIKNKQGNASKRAATKIDLEGKFGEVESEALWGAGKLKGAALNGKINAEAEVNVFTVDLISISAQMIIKGALESVSLSKAIKNNKSNLQ